MRTMTQSMPALPRYSYARAREAAPPARRVALRTTWHSSGIAQAQTVTPDPAVVRENRLLPGNEPGPYAEAWLLLRTRLLQRCREHGWNTLAVTSPRAGAGKTLAAINLAISTARLIDCSVLLVDGNLHRPAVLEHLGLPENRGLNDYLTADMPVEKLLLRPEPFGDLVILPGGKPRQDPVPAGAEHRMIRLVRELKSHAPNHFVILDLPPLLTSDGTLAILQQADATLLVIEDDITPGQDIRNSVDMLAGITLAGTLLNKARDG